MNERRVDPDAERPSFLVDGMLGALARHLRMLGFDAEYCRQCTMETALERAAREGRWFLTRQDMVGLSTPKARILRLLDDFPHLQVLQVLRSIPAKADESRWFTRCLLCNRSLEDLQWEEARPFVPDHIAQTHRHFRRCPSCTRVFWPGTHSLRMRRTMEQWVEQLTEIKAERSDR